jgi:hypothetical protein
MAKIVDQVISANKKYASDFGAKKDLPLPPARGLAILTCMDARLDPAKYAGLAEGDAHVIRNAVGRATDDAIRSLVISHKLLGTQEWFVIHHTNCGMELFTDGVMGELLDDSLKTAQFDGKTWSNPKHGEGASAGRFRTMSMPKKHPAPPSYSFARLGRVLNVTGVSSRSATRVNIGAVRIGVKQRLHFLAAPEEGNGFASDRNQSACPGISAHTPFSQFHKKDSKPPQFDPITAGHCGGNL